MKNKLVESIRKLLIATLLPLRNKWERYLSQFHFSIAFRIAIHYIRLFTLYGALFFLSIVVLYFYVEMQHYEDYAKERVSLLKSGSVAIVPQNDLGKEGYIIYKYTNPVDYKSYEIVFSSEEMKSFLQNAYQDTINPERKRGITIKINEDENTVYTDIVDDVRDDTSLVDKISYNYKDNQKVIVKDFYEYSINGKNYEVYFQYDLTDSVTRMQQFLLLLLIIYAVFIILVARFGKKGIRGLLQPIQAMSATANRLTVNNLNCERLNVVGTKNELKDLAVTINKMLDRLELSYESQKQFVSDASHELRTPIAVIQGYANMLERWGSDDKEVLKESIEAIRNESKSMQDLVEKLLFLSRHDKKTLKLEKARFNMKDIVEEMLRETKLVIRDREISTPRLEKAMTYGDCQALKQALRIFIDNAVKYSKPGDQINVSCYKENNCTIVTVEDTGIGIKKQDVDRIFERFYRSDEVRNEKIGGHGLGLSIARLIILKHTGTIKVRSQYKKGTSFTISIPDYNKLGYMN